MTTDFHAQWRASLWAMAEQLVVGERLTLWLRSNRAWEPLDYRAQYQGINGRVTLETRVIGKVVRVAVRGDDYGDRRPRKYVPCDDSKAILQAARDVSAAIAAEKQRGADMRHEREVAHERMIERLGMPLHSTGPLGSCDVAHYYEESDAISASLRLLSVPRAQFLEALRLLGFDPPTTETARPGRAGGA